MFVYVILFALYNDLLTYYFIDLLLLFLIPLVLRLFKRFVSYLIGKKSGNTEIIKENTYDILSNCEIQKEDQNKLIIYLTLIVFLFFIIILVFIYQETYMAFLYAGMFLLIVLFHLGADYYNRKEFTLTIRLDNTLEFDNSNVNCKLKQANIEKVEKLENWSFKIDTFDKNTITISIPYTSLVKERDKEVRTELLNELFEKIKNQKSL